MVSKLVRMLVVAAIAVGLPLSLLSAHPASAATQAPNPATAPAAQAAPPAAQAAPHAPQAATPFAGLVSADVDDFSFQSLDVDYTLGREEDGTSTLRVVERFVALFPEYDQNRGMRRSIPDSYLGAPLEPELVSITDGEGNPRPAETESEDGEFSMVSRADDYVYGEQTYVFTYTLRNVVRFFEDTGADEFYWNVNGTGWAQDFGRVSARVNVPADLATALTGSQACYVGFQGSAQTCQITADAASDGGATIDASASPVPAYQTVTIAVGFEQGTFTPFDSSYLASPWGWVQGIAGIGVLAAVGVAIATRVRRLRDAPGRPTIIAEYTPPPGMDALESAVLLGRTAKAIPAEVLEQAVVGSIRIIEGRRKALGGVKLKAQLVDPSRADGDGMLLLKALFPGLHPGAEYQFGSSDTRLSTAAQKILKLANEELVTRGLRRAVPARQRTWPVLAAVAAVAVVIITGFIALGASVDPVIPLLLIVGSVLALLLVIALIARKPLTAAGAEVRDHLKGLQEFIEWAEADRIRMLQSPQGAERVRIDPSNPAQMLKLYEVLLPYAVVFGQEKQWAEQLAVLYGPDQSPGWYSGSHGFSAASFAAGISTLSASSSSASTSGGSTGGGSAGGGGGGGGGGGV